jgi:hypothetical protein
MSEHLRPQPVVRPVAEPLGLHEPGVVEGPQMVADERLSDAELLDQVADAQLLAGQKLDDAPAEGVAERSQLGGDVGIQINRHEYGFLSAFSPFANSAVDRGEEPLGPPVFSWRDPYSPPRPAEPSPFAS